MDGRNPFGGKNPHGMYVPLTDDEIEVLVRLAESGEYVLVLQGWGYVLGFRRGRYDPATWDGRPLVVIGDKRISFYFLLTFQAPAAPVEVTYFDLEVQAKGHRLFVQRMPTVVEGKPLLVGAGISWPFALDVALDHIDPGVVKEIKPGAIGLTTRHGNMHLDTHRQALLASVKQGEAAVRRMNAAEALAATKRAGKA